VAAIRQTAALLVHFPYKFRMIPEFEDPHRRETFVYEYRLMYRVEPGCVRILRVVRGRRLLINVHGSFEEPPQEEYTSAAYGSQMIPASGRASPFSTVR
jgi:hypothetical protein